MNLIQFLCAGGCGDSKEYLRVIKNLSTTVCFVLSAILIALIVANIISMNNKKNDAKKCKKKIIIYAVIMIVLVVATLVAHLLIGPIEYDELAHCWCA